MRELLEFLDGSRVSTLKYGTNSTTRGNGDWVNPETVYRMGYAADRILSSGPKIVMVNSGAVACGLELEGILKRPTDLDDLQYYSALGAMRFGQLLIDALAKYGRKAMHTQIPPHIFKNPIECASFERTTARVLARGTTPTFNAPDYYVTKELALHPEVPGIKYSDNDPLSADIAMHSGSDRLVIFTDNGTSGSGGEYSKTAAIKLAESHGIIVRTFSIDELFSP